MIIKTLLEKLKIVDEWEVDEYRARHESGVSIWIANGLFFLYIDKPTHRGFSLIEKIRIQRAIDKLIDKQLYFKLNEKDQ